MLIINNRTPIIYNQNFKYSLEPIIYNMKLYIMKPQGSSINKPGSKYSPALVIYYRALFKTGVIDLTHRPIWGTWCCCQNWQKRESWTPVSIGLFQFWTPIRRKLEDLEKHKRRIFSFNERTNFWDFVRHIFSLVKFLWANPLFERIWRHGNMFHIQVKDGIFGEDWLECFAQIFWMPSMKKQMKLMSWKDSLI